MKNIFGKLKKVIFTLFVGGLSLGSLAYGNVKLTNLTSEMQPSKGILIFKWSPKLSLSVSGKTKMLNNKYVPNYATSKYENGEGIGAFSGTGKSITSIIKNTTKTNFFIEYLNKDKVKVNESKKTFSIEQKAKGKMQTLTCLYKALDKSAKTVTYACIKSPNLNKIIPLVLSTDSKNKNKNKNRNIMYYIEFNGTIQDPTPSAAESKEGWRLSKYDKTAKKWKSIQHQIYVN